MPISRARKFEEFCREYEKAPRPCAEIARIIGVSERTAQRYGQRLRAIGTKEEDFYPVDTPAERVIRFLFWLIRK